MSGWQWALIISGSIIVTLILRKIAGSSHPFRSTLLSMLFGILVLALLNFCSVWTGTSLPVSQLSLAVSAFLGIPGLTTMLLLQLLL